MEINETQASPLSTPDLKLSNGIFYAPSQIVETLLEIKYESNGQIHRWSKCFFRLSTSQFSPAIVAKSASYRSYLTINYWSKYRVSLLVASSYHLNATTLRTPTFSDSLSMNLLGFQSLGLISIADRQDQDVFS